jgi:hypothetical protein
MEILDLKLGGVTLWTWLFIVFVVLVIRWCFREYERWKERRQWRREFKAKEKKWNEENHWEPKMVGGVDCGRWVRNDGMPPVYDEWSPVGALLDRISEKGPGSG